ncbi:hypothetical protein B0H14DRAFT_3643399 [Mycena olivaceomarginata]|nr:hypothetical protein B0H14DRAFT_3643399 [Mycena olivaceomarginata]
MGSTTTDVLIIGAGPAGLLAALALATMKVEVRIIDRRLQDETSGQADGIQPRMHEIWESLGLGAELRERSEHVYRMVTYTPREDGKGIQLKSHMHNMPVRLARFQYEILARIDIIEEMLSDRLKRAGISVERPTVPISLEVETARDAPVKVTVARLNEDILRSQGISLEERGDPQSILGLVDTTEHISARKTHRSQGGSLGRAND